MQVTVVYDARGRIVSLSVLGEVGGGNSGIARGGVIAKTGQKVQTLNLPTGLEKRPLTELHQLLRVEGVGAKARLVEAKSKETRKRRS